jgi:hypothetical protein
MAKKYMRKKNVQKSLAIREIQIKTMMRYHPIPVRTAVIIKKIQSEDEEKRTHTLLVGMETDIAIMENIWRYLKKPKVELPYNLDIPLLCTYPREMKPAYRDTCKHVFIAEPFTISMIQNQPSCPSVDK